VDNSQRLSPNGKRYYLHGWRLLSFSRLAGMRLDQITQNDAESTVFRRPVLDRKTKNKDGRYAPKNETIACASHYQNQALRTLKRMQGKAMEWKALYEKPRITLADAWGRDRLIDESTEDRLDQAFSAPVKNSRTKRMREQAWLFMVSLQDCGMRPDEVFPMRIEDLH
jgi:hypothetical protein